MARCGSPGAARFGWACNGPARRGSLGVARRGSSWCITVRRGQAQQSRQSKVALGAAHRGSVRQCSRGLAGFASARSAKVWHIAAVVVRRSEKGRVVLRYGKSLHGEAVSAVCSVSGHGAVWRIGAWRSRLGRARLIKASSGEANQGGRGMAEQGAELCGKPELGAVRRSRPFSVGHGPARQRTSRQGSRSNDRGQR